MIILAFVVYSITALPGLGFVYLVFRGESRERRSLFHCYFGAIALYLALAYANAHVTLPSSTRIPEVKTMRNVLMEPFFVGFIPAVAAFAHRLARTQTRASSRICNILGAVLVIAGTLAIYGATPSLPE